MTPECPSPEAIQISIELSEKFHHLMTGESAFVQCKAYMKELLQSLALPEDIDITYANDSTLPDRPVIRVTIQDSMVTIWSPLIEDTDELVQLLCHTVYRCRSLLVNEQVVNHLWSLSFPGQNFDSLERSSKNLVIGYCRTLVKMGIKPNLPRDWGIAQSYFYMNPHDVEKMIEEEMARGETRSIRLLVSKEQYERCFDSSGQARHLPDENSDMQRMIRVMNEDLFWELGIVYRIDQLTTADDLQAPWFRIAWNDIVTPPIKGLHPDEFMANDTVGRMGLLNITGTATINPVNSAECTRVNRAAALREPCKQAGLATWGSEAYLVLFANSEIRRNAGAFVSENLTMHYETQLDQHFPELVSQTMGRLDRQKLTQVLRLLVSEEISIHDMPIILEAILSITSVTTADMGKYIVFTNRCGLTCPVASPCQVNSLSVSEITDCVRMAMRRYISHKFTRGGNTLVVYLLSRKIEERLRSSDQLSSEDHQKIMAAVAAEVVEVPMRYQCPVILTSYDIRRQLRNMLELEFPFLAVLSYQELSPDMNIQPIARIEYSET